MKLAIRAALVCAAAVSFSAFAQDKVIRIGVLMPISGPGSYFGVMGKEGIDLALEQLKSAVNGYKLQVQYEDSACSPLQATNTVKRVLDQFKPHIVVGEECSDASLAIAPILEELATELDGKLKIAKVNIDEHDAVAAEFGVRAIPTMILFKGGQVAETLVGMMPKAALKSKLAAHVGA